MISLIYWKGVTCTNEERCKLLNFKFSKNLSWAPPPPHTNTDERKLGVLYLVSKYLGSVSTWTKMNFIYLFIFCKNHVILIILKLLFFHFFMRSEIIHHKFIIRMIFNTSTSINQIWWSSKYGSRKSWTCHFTRGWCCCSGDHFKTLIRIIVTTVVSKVDIYLFIYLFI
jgi:hypothetical protein